MLSDARRKNNSASDQTKVLIVYQCRMYKVYRLYIGTSIIECTELQ